MRERLQADYSRIVEFCRANSLPEEMSKQCADYSSGTWELFVPVLKRIPVSMRNKTFVDFGCKYGLLSPLLLAMGVKQIVGVDAVDEYVDAGKAVLEKLYPSVKIVKCINGYIPLQLESVDIVFMNEVISHVNPSQLETVYSETWRILRSPGIVFISDGNNIGNRKCREALIGLYEAWENGPDGTRTDRDVVTKCFRNRRLELLRKKYPSLEESQAEYLARNTSGIYGEFLEKVISEYVDGGELIERPYQKGSCPMNPLPPGAVMERGFFPEQVELSLAGYGFRAYQVKPMPVYSGKGYFSRLKYVALLGRYVLKRVLKPHFEKTDSSNFQIVGVKE